MTCARVALWTRGCKTLADGAAAGTSLLLLANGGEEGTSKGQGECSGLLAKGDCKPVSEAAKSLFALAQEADKAKAGTAMPPEARPPPSSPEPPFASRSVIASTLKTTGEP